MMMEQKLHLEIALPITVGDNVWIGTNVSVQKAGEAIFSRLVKQFSEKEGVTEALKAENQMLWVQRMNHIRSAAMENVSSELIYC